MQGAQVGHNRTARIGLGVMLLGVAAFVVGLVGSFIVRAAFDAVGPDFPLFALSIGELSAWLLMVAGILAVFAGLVTSGIGLLRR